MRMESSTCSASISEEKARACSVERTRPPSRAWRPQRRSVCASKADRKRWRGCGSDSPECHRAPPRAPSGGRDRKAPSKAERVNCCDSTTCFKFIRKRPALSFSFRSLAGACKVGMIYRRTGTSNSVTAVRRLGSASPVMVVPARLWTASQRCSKEVMTASCPPLRKK